MPNKHTLKNRQTSYFTQGLIQCFVLTSSFPLIFSTSLEQLAFCFLVLFLALLAHHKIWSPVLFHKSFLLNRFEEGSEEFFRDSTDRLIIFGNEATNSKEQARESEIQMQFAIVKSSRLAKISLIFFFILFIVTMTSKTGGVKVPFEVFVVLSVYVARMMDASDRKQRALTVWLCIGISLVGLAWRSPMPMPEVLVWLTFLTTYFVLDERVHGHYAFHFRRAPVEQFLLQSFKASAGIGLLAWLCLLITTPLTTHLQKQRGPELFGSPHASHQNFNSRSSGMPGPPSKQWSPPNPAGPSGGVGPNSSGTAHHAARAMGAGGGAGAGAGGTGGDGGGASGPGPNLDALEGGKGIGQSHLPMDGPAQDLAQDLARDRTVGGAANPPVDAMPSTIPSSTIPSSTPSAPLPKTLQEKARAPFQRHPLFVVALSAALLLLGLYFLSRNTTAQKDRLKAVDRQKKKALRAYFKAIRSGHYTPSEEILRTYHGIERALTLVDLGRPTAVPPKNHLEATGRVFPALSKELRLVTELHHSTLYGANQPEKDVIKTLRKSTDRCLKLLDL